jgi:hypothetical protein
MGAAAIPLLGASALLPDDTGALPELIPPP